MIIVSSFVGWYSGLLNSVSRKESFNLSQQGLNDKYVIPELLKNEVPNQHAIEDVLSKENIFQFRFVIGIFF